MFPKKTFDQRTFLSVGGVSGKSGKANATRKVTGEPDS